jgi:hypothetical protein
MANKKKPKKKNYTTAEMKLAKSMEAEALHDLKTQKKYTPMTKDQIRAGLMGFKKR